MGACTLGVNAQFLFKMRLPGGFAATKMISHEVV